MIAPQFVLKQKNQKFKAAQRLLCRTGLTLQNEQNLGRNLFTPCFAARSQSSVKISYALQPHMPPSFYPFSLEAVGLTRNKEIMAIFKSVNHGSD